MGNSLVLVFAISALSNFFHDLPSRKVVVFRHHPGLIDTHEVIAARNQDSDLILRTLQHGEIGFCYEGGLGQGSSLSIRLRDAIAWENVVNDLIAKKLLKQYVRWGLNRKGYGLVLIR
jgi:hypothetical protein